MVVTVSSRVVEPLVKVRAIMKVGISQGHTNNVCLPSEPIDV